MIKNSKESGLRMGLSSLNQLLALLTAAIFITGALPAWGQKPAAEKPAASASQVSPSASGAGGNGKPYKIGPGDVLEVNVWKEPEASVATAVVRPDGMISLPLIKEVKAAGHTPTSLQEDISGKLAKLIRDADVTVVVKEMKSEKVYVLGAVKKEGPIAIQSPLTVLEAIAEAGGLTDYAKRKQIYILRQEDSGQKRIAFDYTTVIRGEHVEQNILLQRGDTVVVP